MLSTKLGQPRTTEAPGLVLRLEVAGVAGAAGQADAVEVVEKRDRVPARRVDEVLELGFIINYGIKHRMASDAEGEED